MFCPNCAAQNDAEQHYCRTCGLKLDAIAANIAGQFPSMELSAQLRRRRRFELLGTSSLSIAGLIGLCTILAQALYYKLMLFGPEALFLSAFIALIVFLFLSVFFFAYPKLFMKIEKLDSLIPATVDESEASAPTNKLLNDPPFEPASVTEHSTELLPNVRGRS
jgi:hypothetical protein